MSGFNPRLGEYPGDFTDLEVLKKIKEKKRKKIASTVTLVIVEASSRFDFLGIGKPNIYVVKQEM